MTMIRRKKRMRRGGMIAAASIAIGFAAVWIAGPPDARSQPPIPPPLAGSAPPALNAFSDGFESDDIAWRREETDAPIRPIAHERTDKAAREGKRSERLAFEAGVGSGLYYTYELPRIPATSLLQVSLLLRGDRIGPQLFARIVLPGDIDPETKRPSTVIIPSSAAYEASGRWERLEINDFPRKIERQARVLRVKTKRKVPIEGAYLDRLVLNLYGGQGANEIFIDDLRIAPVPAELANNPGAADEAPAGPAAAPAPARDPRATAPGAPRPAKPGWDMVRLEDSFLSRLDPTTGKRYEWIFTAVDAPGADIDALMRSGFDLIASSIEDDPGFAVSAAQRGFLLMPDVGPLATRSDLPVEAIVDRMRGYPVANAAAFWNVGENLGDSLNPAERKRQRDRTRSLVAALRRAADAESAGPNRVSISPLTTATVSGTLNEYVKGQSGLSMIGVPHRGWGAMQDPFETYLYLSQRRTLTALDNANALFWTWVPAAPPPQARIAIWGNDEPPNWGWPQVQPEQVRLYSYAALSAGLKGLGFRADAELTRESGRGRLIELAFLNAETRLFASILAKQDGPPNLLDAYLEAPPINQPMGRRPRIRREPPPHPTIKAAAIPTRDNRGSLVLVTDYALGAQWQPPQMAVGDKVGRLSITIPAPESAQAYEISLGDTKVLDRERAPGGIKVILPDFGGTTAILVTTDQTLIQRVTEAIARIRCRSILMAIDQGHWQIEWVAGVHSQLVALGRGVGEADKLLGRANEHLQAASEAFEREEYGLAWDEARRVGRPLRVLMRAYWTQAIEDLVRITTPSDPAGAKSLIRSISSPATTSFNTLPQHYVWLRFIAEHGFSENMLPSGDFNHPEAITKGGWADASYGYERIPTAMTSFPLDPQRGDLCLKLAAGPTTTAELDKLPQFLDHPAVAIRSPGVPVKAGQLLRIRVQVRMPRPCVPGAGGLIVRDSMGGEQFQFRSYQAIPEWREVILFRRPPVDGLLHVTLGLAGYGEAYFDDLIVERVQNAPPAASAPSFAPGPELSPNSSPFPPPPAPAGAAPMPVLPGSVPDPEPNADVDADAEGPGTTN